MKKYDTFHILVISNQASLYTLIKNLIPASFQITFINPQNLISSKNHYDLCIIDNPQYYQSLKSLSTTCLCLTSQSLISHHHLFILPPSIDKDILKQMISHFTLLNHQLYMSIQTNMDLKNKQKHDHLVYRAKCLLIEKQKMSENQAHRYIEKKAMDLCQSKHHIALAIIKKLGV